MKKGLILGLIAGAAAAGAAALIYSKKKNEYCCCDDLEDEDLACDDCCGDCCDCDEDINDIPAEKAEESVIITDACACVCYDNAFFCFFSGNIIDILIAVTAVAAAIIASKIFVFQIITAAIFVFLF